MKASELVAGLLAESYSPVVKESDGSVVAPTEPVKQDLIVDLTKVYDVPGYMTNVGKADEIVESFLCEIDESIRVRWTSSAVPTSWVSRVHSAYPDLGQFVREVDVLLFGKTYRIIQFEYGAFSGPADTDGIVRKITHFGNTRFEGRRKGRWKITDAGSLINNLGNVLIPVPDEIVTMKRLFEVMAPDLADGDGESSVQDYELAFRQQVLDEDETEEDIDTEESEGDSGFVFNWVASL